MAQSVEHVIGNDEVIGSIPITSSKEALAQASASLLFAPEITHRMNDTMIMAVYSGVKIGTEAETPEDEHEASKPMNRE